MARRLYLAGPRSVLPNEQLGKGARMPGDSRFVITYAHGGPLASAGLPWCIALATEDGAIQPVAWVRSGEDADRLRRALNADSDEPTPPPTPVNTRRSSETAGVVVSDAVPDVTAPATPLSAMEWIALAVALLAAAGAVFLIERVIPRPMR